MSRVRPHRVWYALRVHVYAVRMCIVRVCLACVGVKCHKPEGRVRLVDVAVAVAAFVELIRCVPLRGGT